MGCLLQKPPFRFIRISYKAFCRLCLPAALWVLLLAALPCYSFDRPFNNGANWGGTGLMETPNARILEDGEIRMGYTQALPYRWFTADMGVLPGLELGARLTQITNYPSPYYFGNLDRAFDIKYQIFPESRNLPAVAIGINDFYGTRLFPSEYIAFSRQIYPFDVTIGLGSKRFKGNIKIPWLENYGLFGGVEWVVNNRLKLMAEYNPIDYREDKKSARGVPEGAEFPINFGLRAALLKGVHLGLSFQRGNTLGLQLQIQSLFGEQLLPQNPDPPRQTDVDRRPFRERDQKEMLEQIHQTIRDSGFSKVSVYTDGQDLTAEFENGIYFSNQKAAGRVLRLLLYHSPSDAQNLSAIIKKRDIPIVEISVKAEHFEKFLLRKIPEDLFFNKLLHVRLADNRPEEDQSFLISTPDPVKRFSFNVRPNLSTYWFDLSNYLQLRLALEPSFSLQLWTGAYLSARYVFPVYANVDQTSEPAPEPVRSDIGQYMEDNYSFERILVDQTIRFSERLFGRVAFGYLEKMYAGAGAEGLYVIGNGQFALGVEASYVIKREPKTHFDLLDFRRHTLFLNGYYHYPQLDLTVKAKYGRFLAGDVGWMFDVSRRFPTGTTVGFFYTITDTDVVPGEFNKDYNHKGVYIEFPERMFLKKDSSQVYYYSLSPWTRDVGAIVYGGTPLFSYVKDLLPSSFLGKIDRIKE